MHLGHWSSISKAITEETGLVVTAQEAYDVLHPEERHAACGKEKKFISFSVGYRYCGKASVCPCAKAAVAAKVSRTKQEASPEAKAQEKLRREETNRQRYGVSNQFQRLAPRTISEDELTRRRATNIERYGHSAAQSGVVKTKIAKTNVEKYGHRSALGNADVRSKATATLFERYGVDNPMKSDHLRLKAMDTVHQRYGVDNVSQSPDVANKIRSSLVSKYKDSVLDRVCEEYAVVGDYKGAKYRHEFRCLKCQTVFEDTLINGGDPRCKKCHPVGSLVEGEIANHIESFGMAVGRNDRSIIRPYELDIVVPEKKLAIEYCGLYWHSEERLGKTYHLDKMEACNAAGYRLVTIFEDEWLSNKELVLSRLSHILGVQSSRHYARTLDIRAVPKEEAVAFLNDHHSQGGLKSPINLGLYRDTELLALMTFGKARFGGGSHYELVRYCSTGSVVGGASKLFSHFVKTHSPSEVMSYADLRWSDGGLYRSLGFEEVAKTSPNYWYFKTKRREHRMKFMKNKLVEQGYSSDLTEKDIMKSIGYSRIYDCGNLKFIWKNDGTNNQKAH